MKNKDKRINSAMMLSLKTKNWALIGGGVLFVIVGFYFLHLGSMVLAPILLSLGYFVLIPIGVVIR
ncbi:MAG: hypothetical protein PHX21_00525 [bacterium]|nr:hypothetical protein [bacterium]